MPRVETPLPRRITAEYLESLRTHAYRVGRFREEWPDGVDVTARNVENASRAYPIGLDTDWLADAVLPAPVWTEWNRVTTAACVEWCRVAAACVERSRVAAPDWGEYDRVMAAATADWNRVMAQAFVAAWLSCAVKEDCHAES